MFGPIRIHSGPLGCIRTRSEAFGSVWTFLKNFGIWGFFNNFSTCGQGYLGFAKMYLEQPELLLELLLQMLLELLLLLLLFLLPRTW